MKTKRLSLLSLIPILALPLSSMAADYTLSLGGLADWSEAAWSPASGPSNTGDNLTLSTSAQSDLYLGGDRTLDQLTFSSGTLRIWSGTKSGNGDSLLTLGGITVNGGSLYFANKTASTSSLAVSVGSITVNSGSLFLGRSGLSLGKLTVSGTTSIASGRLALQALPGDINLGRLAFDSNLNASLDLGNSTGSYSRDYTVTITALSGANKNAKITTSTTESARPTLLIKSTQANTEADFAGLIENGTAVVKVQMAGVGTQVFSRKDGNTYTGGTEILGGTLVLTNETGSGLGSGNVTVTGGTLAGPGRIATGAGNSITVKNNGVIAPGASLTSKTTLTLSGELNGNSPVLTMEAGATFLFNLGSGNTSDRLKFHSYTVGDLVLHSNAINITGAQAGTFVLFSFTDTAGNAVASGLNSGLVLGTGFDGFLATIYYDDPNFGGPGSVSLKLEAIPEPSSVTLAIAALGSLAVIIYTQRRRHGRA